MFDEFKDFVFFQIGDFKYLGPIVNMTVSFPYKFVQLAIFTSGNSKNLSLHNPMTS